MGKNSGYSRSAQIQHWRDFWAGKAPAPFTAKRTRVLVGRRFHCAPGPPRIEQAADRILGTPTAAIAKREAVTPGTVRKWLRRLHPDFFRLVEQGKFPAIAHSYREAPPSGREELRGWLVENLLDLLAQAASCENKSSVLQAIPHENHPRNSKIDRCSDRP
jgi:hypothetical protein